MPNKVHASHFHPCEQCCMSAKCSQGVSSRSHVNIQTISILLPGLSANSLKSASPPPPPGAFNRPVNCGRKPENPETTIANHRLQFSVIRIAQKLAKVSYLYGIYRSSCSLFRVSMFVHLSLYELSRFVYICDHVTLHVEFIAQKVYSSHVR